MLIIPPYYYFIIIDQIDQKIKLFTFENLKNLRYCHEGQEAVQINEFSSSTLDWIQKPIFPNKYKNFYGCEMQLAIIDTSNFFVQKGIDQDPEGLIFDIFKELEIRLKFYGHYFGCDVELCKDAAINNPLLYNIAEVISLDGYAYSQHMDGQWNFMALNVECS